MSAKVISRACGSGGDNCNVVVDTVNLLLGELEKIDLEVSFGSSESLRRLYGISIDLRGRQSGPLL